MRRIVILYRRGAASDAALVETLRIALTEASFQVHVDQHLRISVDWAVSIADKIRSAEAVIAVVSNHAAGNEMLEYELEIANDAKLKDRSMHLILAPIGADAAARAGIGPILGGHQSRTWEGEADTAPLIAELLEVLEAPTARSPSEILVGSTGGAVSSESPLYIERQADRDLRSMLERGESTTLIRGPRQTGKTSLLAKGIRMARESGWFACVSDFQRLGSNLYDSEDEFYRKLAADLSKQMFSTNGTAVSWDWDPDYGPTANLDEFVRSMVWQSSTRVIWLMDEADSVFPTQFSDSFFALVRSWHNASALLSEEIWSRFSVVIAYATEAHLFIQDLNQSPFNVGARIDLNGFSLRQTEELNDRYGCPLRGIDQIAQLFELLDGQPYLTRIAFDQLVKTGGNLRGLTASADQEDGPFGDHLRRLLVSVSQLTTVRDTVRRVLANEFVEPSPEVSRLVAAGILVKNSAGNHVIRCRLYRRYLERHLATTGARSS